MLFLRRLARVRILAAAVRGAARGSPVVKGSRGDL